MPRRPTIVLFDIDGTLVTTGGAARRAFEQAITEQLGDASAFAFSFGGMTDPLIMRRGLEAMARPYSETLATPGSSMRSSAKPARPLK